MGEQSSDEKKEASHLGRLESIQPLELEIEHTRQAIIRALGIPSEFLAVPQKEES